ncbi:MAG: thioredoxin-dependent thiol peroxidase [Candidatus Brocadiia bacterium]
MTDKPLMNGHSAPNFSLANQDERLISLSEHHGRYVVLYFYPKDDTPGCTTEAKDFTSRIDEFRKAGAEVIGVSPDSTQSHLRFCIRHDLKLNLLTDPDHKICDAYGVWQMKEMHGRQYYGVVRSTFLIDPHGKIVGEWRNVRVDGHVEEVLAQLKGHIVK